MEMATTYTKAVSMMGAEILALRELIVVTHALAGMLDNHAARRELLTRVDCLEKVTNQLMR